MCVELNKLTIFLYRSIKLSLQIGVTLKDITINYTLVFIFQ